MAREQAIDFMGVGTLGDSKEKDEVGGRNYSLLDSDPSTFLGSRDCGSPSKADGVGLGGSPMATMNNGTFLSSVAFPGVRHSMWNKAAAFQHLLPSKNLQEERFVEQSAENVPERSYQQAVHPVQTWWRGDQTTKCFPGACDDQGPSTQVLGNLKGAFSKNVLPFSMPSINVPKTGFSEAGQKGMPVSGSCDKLDSAPLTIFYGGNVNVFNDITAERAQAIMFLASGGNMQGSSTANLTSLVNKIQGDNEGCCNDMSVAAASSPGQPVVPRALPQARKASLARFLEKRRERVQSKAPYFLKQADSSSPEERFSSSNDIASYRTYGNFDDSKKMTMAA